MKTLRPIFRARRRSASAFTLLELLVTLGVVSLLFALVAPAIKGMTSAADLTRAAYTIQGALDQARMYAVANNTYTWVGFFEEDNAQPSQTPAVPGVGRVVIALVASRDGSRIYNKAQASAGNPSAQALPSSRLVLISKPIKLNNVHIFNAASQSIGTRAAGVIKDQNIVGLTSLPLLFSMQYPLVGTAGYTFGVRPVGSSGGVPVANGIVQFNPRGEALSDAGPVIVPAPVLEIAIKEAHGNRTAAGANVIALNISGLTGQTTLFRP
ncbi:MAG: Tfp pilus assembly protein FimT/FimU [Chthoniobacteraceae bacterium]